jgi:hypothetical protein
MAKKLKKKSAKKKTVKRKKHTALQRDYEVGNKKPPKEHQFKPGQSGNPKGQPKHRTHLWTWFCTYMGMSHADFEKLKPNKLTPAQQTALKLVENARNGKYSGSERLARHVFDREEGKPTEYLVLGGTDNSLSDEECEDIRKLLKKNYAD